MTAMTDHNDIPKAARCRPRRPLHALLVLLSSGALALVGCKAADAGTSSDTGGTSAVPVAVVAVDPPAVSLVVGQSAQLSASPRDAQGNALSGRTVRWATSNASVASLNALGAVTAVAAGNATITATSEGQQGTSVVTVSAPPPAPVANVTITPGAATVAIGATQQLTATARDAAGAALSGRAFTWASGNEAVATVTQGGLVTAIAAGQASIIATSEGIAGGSTITVPVPPPVPVATVAVSPSAATLVTGQTQQLSATTRDGNGNVLTGRAVSWTTSNAAAATVSSTGLVSATGAGSATITATSEGHAGTSAITVNAPPPVAVASVSVSPASASLLTGQTQQLAATTRDANGGVLTGRVVTWTTSNAAAATVSSGGLVSAVGAGSATITATSEGQAGTSAITVSAPPPVAVATVGVTPATASLTVGQTQQLTATTRDAGGNVLTGRTVTWSTSNASAATVSSTGLVSAVAAGSATITATSEGKSGSSAVTVTAAATGQVIFTEGFESGNLSQWQDGVDATRHTVLTDATQAHSGTHVLRVRYVAGDEGGWLTRFFMPGYDSVRVSAWIYFPTAWTGDTRFVRLGGSRTDDQWSAMGQAGKCATGTNFFSSAVFIDYANNALGPMHFYTYYVGMPTESDGVTCYGRFGPGSTSTSTNGSTAISKGSWHRIELWMKLNTPGQANGVERYYLDGVMKSEWTGLVLRTSNILMLNWAELSFRSQQTSSVDRFLYVDDVTVTANASGQ